ncbi:MAG: hypothetical protein IJC73_02375 [Lentisphaeria bacterium]|nr:hypothetical protein [Lentisphaeria bacterium]
MLRFFRIADNTFKESIREPVYFLMLLCALVLIAHFPSMALFVFFEQLKLVVDSSMATSLFFGLLCAVLCASNTVSRELRNGSVLLLLSKPVARPVFILAKIAGIVVAAGLFSLICNISSYISIYIAQDQFRLDMGAYAVFMIILGVGCVAGMLSNFWRGSSFSSVATVTTASLLTVYALYCIFTKEEPALHMEDLTLALILILLAVLTMATLAVVFATRLSTVANLTLCSFIFFLGLVSGYLQKQASDYFQTLGSEYAIFDTLVSVFYAVLPNWQFFWLADAVAVNREIPLAYLGWSALYLLFFTVICSMWAVAIFQHKEIAGDVHQ